MLYLKNTTDLQAVLLHTTGLETIAWEAATFSLFSTISDALVAVVTPEVSASAEYVELRFMLPEIVPQGEYGYLLEQDGRIVGSGLAFIGEPRPVAEPATAGEGIETIVIEQYGE